MSKLAFVAAALSAMLNTPVKTYEECEAECKLTGYDIGSVPVLDLGAIHGNSLMFYREEAPKNPKTGEYYYEYPSKGPIQIFIKSLSGDSHAMFVFKHDTVHKLKLDIQEKLGYDTTKMRLEFGAKELQDFRTLSSYNIEYGDNIYILFRLLGGYDGYVIKDDSLSPGYDYDFTNLRDNGAVYTRGNHVYKRPYGWERIAFNVGKFGPDTKWLGCVGNSPDEWPVSFHGTRREFADSIASEGYLLSRGRRFAYGRGIYSSPEISVAEQYSVNFVYDDGIRYKVVVQNRVNPANLKKIEQINYWVSPNDVDIRPYGLCFKKVDT